MSSTTVFAQGGTLSPYSQFGLGKIADQSVGAARGMNGVGIAFREHSQVNNLNPASYSALDSITFLFDVGMTMQNTNYSEKGKAKNVKTADFEYAVGAFRAYKHLGMAFGVIPYTNIGYDYAYTSSPIDGYQMAPSTGSSTTYTMQYLGSGGLHQAFVGIGYEPLKGLSVGMNASYLWGEINNAITTSYSDAYVNPLAKIFSGSVANYKLDFGVQYNTKINKNDFVTVGVTFSPGHSLGTSPECLIVSGDSLKAYAGNAYSVPTEIGFGIAYKHKQIWRLGFDFDLQTWGKISTVDFISADEKRSSIGRTTTYKNRQSYKLGGEYCKDLNSRSFWQRLRYRMGVGYSTPYFFIGDNNGPREISVSAGVGVPIINNYNHRSIVNVGFGWSNIKAPGMLTENTLMLNLGISFNERWFAKWKFE